MKIFFSLIICIIIATSCSEQKKATNYDNLRDQLVFDVFTQLKGNNHQAALAAFDKLSRKFSDNQFATLFIAKEKKNLYLKKAQKTLDTDMLTQTLELLEKAKQEEQVKIIKEFIQIRAYLSKRPFKTSATAFESYDQLTRVTPLVAENKIFKAFLQKEDTLANELKKKEYQALLLEMVKTYDKLLLTNDNFSYILAMKFPRVLPKQPRFITNTKEAIKILKQKDSRFSSITSQSFLNKLKSYPLQSPGKLDQAVYLFQKNKHKKGLALMRLLESELNISNTLKRAVFHQSPLLTGLMRKVTPSEVSALTMSALLDNKFDSDRKKTKLEIKRLLKEAKRRKEKRKQLEAKVDAEVQVLEEVKETDGADEVIEEEIIEVEEIQ